MSSPPRFSVEPVLPDAPSVGRSVELHSETASRVRRGAAVGGHVGMDCVWCLFFSSVQKPYGRVGVSG